MQVSTATLNPSCICRDLGHNVSTDDPGEQLEWAGGRAQWESVDHSSEANTFTAADAGNSATVVDTTTAVGPAGDEPTAPFSSSASSPTGQGLTDSASSSSAFPETATQTGTAVNTDSSSPEGTTVTTTSTPSVATGSTSPPSSSMIVTVSSGQQAAQAKWYLASALMGLAITLSMSDFFGV